MVQSRFDEFTEQMFRDSIEGDFVGSLFFVEDPDAYGLDRTDLEVVIGPEESDEAFREGGKMAKSMLPDPAPVRPLPAHPGTAGQL